VEGDVERARVACPSPAVPAAAAIASPPLLHLSPSAYASTAQPWSPHCTSRMPPRQSQPHAAAPVPAAHAATHARSFSRVPKPQPAKPRSGPTGPSWWPPDKERHRMTNLLRLTFPSASSSSSAVGHAGTSAGHHRARGHRVHRCSLRPPSEPGAAAKAVK
jgi:hypothetical protein